MLDVNFRCHGAIVRAASRVIAENANRIPKAIFSVHEDGAGLRLCRTESEDTLRQTVADMLVEEQRSGTLAQCAVICRTNLECGFWAQTLHEAGIPYTMREKAEKPIQSFCDTGYLRLSGAGAGRSCKAAFLTGDEPPCQIYEAG